MPSDTPETPATGPFAAAPKARDTSADPGPKAPNTLLTRPTDYAARPGFRSAPNQKSKAQKAPAKKK